ncbi:HlyD family type I secretion periplasmic adaptor subunit [Brevundimonas sp. TWP2-3-2]|uniref:HlyD family type I secretion periplasmic adaptor subunit n=1 Tax=unclassified Brevundimonas TaxID=2622653 RepID=UPI003CE85450
MNFDLNRIFADKRQLEAPVVGAPDTPLSAEARESMRAPIVAGMAVVIIFVLGLGIWASVAPIWGAVVASGSVRVEGNRQTLKSREGGTVREILVRNGDLVQQGQVLLRFDDGVPRAQVAVMSNQYDVALMQRARFQAEVSGRSSVPVPAELLARASDPRVAATILNETTLFNSRLAAIQGQGAILNQRFEQLLTARSGLNVQVESIDQQVALIQQELEGYQTLYERGFAPRTLVLRNQRALAEIGGRRGALVADITRNQQAAGETRLQLAQLYEQRASEAATGLRDAEARISDVEPRLDAADLSLAATRVTAPMTGYVLSLSQFTVGGVAQAGEVLMDVVPINAPLVVRVRVRPTDIDEVRVGMDAEVSLLAFSTNKVPKMLGKVTAVSADALTTEDGVSFFEADVRIGPDELRKLPEGARLDPGMPAQAMIRTGRRTVMSYLLGPIGQITNNALREQ